MHFADVFETLRSHGLFLEIRAALLPDGTTKKTANNGSGRPIRRDDHCRRICY